MARQKSIMAAKAFVLIAAVCLSWGSLAQTADADKLTVRSDAPDRYTVQKGDTLWGIAGKYLDKPWRWPEIWNMNKDQIKNPHWIYPGDVIVLSRNGNGNGEPRLSIEKISPSVRASPLPHSEIPSIPPSDIEPFLTHSFIAGPDGLSKAAEIVEARARSRILQGSNDFVYAVGVTQDKGTRWDIFRPGKAIRDIEGKLLGIEYRYLGNTEVERFGSDANEASTLRILSSNEEISVGDRLVPVPSEVVTNYVPHAPNRTIEAFIVSSFRGSSEIGRREIVVIDQGAKQGVEVGHVLAVYRQVAPIIDPRPNTEREQIVRGFDQTTWYKTPNKIRVPDERIALAFVFRVFENASYALTLNTTDPVNVGDFVRNP
ncbi:MAG: LysM peptidoglycan-binding domain-containing protein [Proteobacteria bacterium]|nr:LysM peptidoglycan-binding domain-containing protein [Pseudomonadota bacterium]